MGNWTSGKRAPSNATLRPILVTPDEEWRSVVGYEGLYSVSSCGRVRSDRPSENGGMLKQSYKGQDGYVGVRLVYPGQWQKGGYCPLTQTLVAAAFIGPRLPGMQIDHKDGNKQNNAVSNLEYVTGAENHRRAVEKGLHAHGTRHHAAKLTEDQVRAIRLSPASDAANAIRYGVSESTVYSARTRHTWKRVA